MKGEAVGASAAGMAMTDHLLLYIGTYSTRGSVGIYTARFDGATGALSGIQPAAELQDPIWLTRHPQQPILYAARANEMADTDAPGGVVAYAVDAASGALSLMGEQSARGMVPCYLTVDGAARWLVSANYGDGTLALLPLDDEGRLEAASDVYQAEGASTHPTRQQGPHLHSAVLTPDGRFILAPDLGSARVWVLAIDEMQAKLRVIGGPMLPGGTGPRHFAFHPNGRWGYLVGELNSTVTIFAFDAESGALTAIQTAPMLPGDFSGESTGAHLAFSADGRFLYASNRGHDSLVIFACDPANGHLEPVGHAAVRGQTPRHFALLADDRYLLVAAQESDRVTVFARDAESGGLTFVAEAAMPAPVCICPVDG